MLYCAVRREPGCPAVLLEEAGAEISLTCLIESNPFPLEEYNGIVLCKYI